MTLTSVNNFPRLINTQGQCASSSVSEMPALESIFHQMIAFFWSYVPTKESVPFNYPRIGSGRSLCEGFSVFLNYSGGRRKESFLGVAVSDNTAPHPISVARPPVIPSSLTSFCLSQEKRGVYTLMWYFLPVPSTLFILCMWTSCLFSLSQTVSKSKFTLSVFDLFLF